jgi:hypothetical protein
MFLVNNVILMAIEMYRNALIHENLMQRGWKYKILTFRASFIQLEHGNFEYNI